MLGAIRGLVWAEPPVREFGRVRPVLVSKYCAAAIAFGVSNDVLAIGILYSAEQRFSQFNLGFCLFGMIYQIYHFFRVLNDIVEFLKVPNAMILNELMGRRPDCKGRRRMRKIIFPELFVKQRITPGLAFCLVDQGGHAAALIMIRHDKSGPVQQGWCNIQIGDHFVNLQSGGDF